jgi:hypothetical protein
MHEVATGTLVRQQVGEEPALVDLQAPLLRLAVPPLSRDLLSRRHQSRVAVGGPKDQLLDTDCLGEPARELVVDLPDAIPKERRPALDGRERAQESAGRTR